MASLQKYCDWYDSIRKVSLENQFIASPCGSRNGISSDGTCNSKKINSEIATSSDDSDDISSINPYSSSSSETSTLSGRRYLEGYIIQLP